MNVKRWLAPVLVLALLLGLLCGCAQPVPAETNPTTGPAQQAQPSDTPGALADKPTPAFTPVQLGQTKPAESYDEVASLLVASARRWYGNRGVVTEDAADSPGAFAPTAAPAEPEANGLGGGGDDFGTNVQVAGVDELDLVKTDGSYLYIATERGFQILRADGAETAVVSRTELPETDETEDSDASSYVMGLFVQGDRLALAYQFDSWSYDGGAYESVDCLRLAIYDVSDRTAPTLLADLGQDGYSASARMKDGVVYLVTSQYVYLEEEDAAPEDWVPCVYRNADASLLPAGSIYLCPESSSSSFSVVGLYALDSAQMLDSCAFTDACDTVYMDHDGLYLARTVETDDSSEPYTENQYTVIDYTIQTSTELKKLTFTDNKLTLAATATVPGALLNQFSMDVYEGNVRLATTVYREAYSVYTDEAYGWENYVWYDSTQTNQVTVLDGSLQQLGVLEDLVTDERIYSVRFLGVMGYVVTYESIDPVFAIDLSDPANPTLLSSLELPGVSQYLHPYGAGRLFGFGQALDENARSDGLQLSMFDVSDPKALSLEGQTILPDGYSVALYDHHAILVDASKNLICFPMYDYEDGNSTVVAYSYQDGSFAARGSVELFYYSDDARSIDLGDYLYICSAYVTYVIDLDGFGVVAELSDAVG